MNDRIGIAPLGNGRGCCYDGCDELRPSVAYAYLRIGMHGKCMEIGVQHGNHAKIMCDVLKPSLFVGVDPWENIDKSHVGEVYYESNYGIAQRRLQGYGCVRLMRGRSAVVLPTFADNTFDFVYIDGDHWPDSSVNDVRQALRITRLYGIVGGHDYGRGPGTAAKNDNYGDVDYAVNTVFDGLFVDAMGGDWWVVVTPDTKKRMTG